MVHNPRAGLARPAAREVCVSKPSVISDRPWSSTAPPGEFRPYISPEEALKEFTIRAAQAGKHVICEKPMALNAKECQEMIDACKKAGRQLMIAYRIQYEPFNKLVMQWARSEEFGKVKLIDRIHLDPRCIQAQLHEDLAGQSCRVTQKWIEVGCSVKHKAFALKRATVATDHVVLLYEQHLQSGASQQVGAKQSSNAGAYHDAVIRLTRFAAKSFKPATHLN